MRFNFFALIMALSISVKAAEITNKQEVEERIKPIGQVHLESSNELSPTRPTQTGSSVDSAKAGQAIYEQYCSVCHRDGLAGAPRFQVAADWQVRLDHRTLDDLVASAMKGINAMPSKGTCMQCSEEDIKHAIQFMLPQS